MRRASEIAAAFAFYLGLVVWLTWPLARQLTVALPDTWIGCRLDGLQMAWVLAYQSHRLVTDPCSLPDANIYFPASRALFTGEAGFGALVLFMPVFLASGNPALAYNVTFLGGVALTAWALHLVLLRWTGSHAAGALGGWTLLTTRWVLWNWVPSAPTYGVMFWTPPIILLAAGASARLRKAFLLLTLVVLQGLTTAYMAVAVLVPLGLLAAGRSLRPATRRAGLCLLAILVLAAGTLGVAYAGYVRARTGAVSPSQTIWFADRFTVLSSGLLHRGFPTAVPLAALALIAAGVVVVLVRREREPAAAGWRHAGLWAVTGILLSLGSIRVGDHLLPSPHALAATWLPVAGLMRRVDRLGAVALLGAALLVGLAFAACTRRLGAGLRVLLLLVVGGAMYAEYSRGIGVPPQIAAWPLPRAYPVAAAPSRASPVLDAVRARGGPVVEVPVPRTLPGRLDNPMAHARAMYRSIFHWQPLLNGYSGFWPAGFPERMQLVQRLPGPAAVAQLRRDAGLAMILVDLERLAPAGRAHWLALASSGREDLRLLARDEHLLLFAVTE